MLLIFYCEQKINVRVDLNTNKCFYYYFLLWNLYYNINLYVNNKIIFG